MGLLEDLSAYVNLEMPNRPVLVTAPAGAGEWMRSTGTAKFFEARTSLQTLQQLADEIDQLATIPAVDTAADWLVAIDTTDGTAYKVQMDEVGGGGGGAPTDATYLTVNLETGLSNERRLAQGEGITITDGGANGNMTVALNSIDNLSPATPVESDLVLFFDTGVGNRRCTITQLAGAIDLADLNTRDYSDLTNRSHVLAGTAGLGADHTVSGLTAGQVLRATAATTAAFQNLVAGDIPDLSGTYVTGVTAGEGLTGGGSGGALTIDLRLSDLANSYTGAIDKTNDVLAIEDASQTRTEKVSPATFFAGMGLPDLGVRDYTAITYTGLTTGHVWQAVSATSAGFQQLSVDDLAEAVPDISGTPGADEIARWLDADTIQGGTGTLTAAGVLAGLAQLTVDNLRIDGNTLISIDLNGNISILPNGTGTAIVGNAGHVQVGESASATNYDIFPGTNDRINLGREGQAFRDLIYRNRSVCPPRTATIDASGALDATALGRINYINPNSGTSDTLVKITGGVAGQRVILRAAPANTITIEDDTASPTTLDEFNLIGGSDLVIGGTNGERKFVELEFTTLGTNNHWVEIQSNTS